MPLAGHWSALPLLHSAAIALPKGLARDMLSLPFPEGASHQRGSFHFSFSPSRSPEAILLGKMRLRRWVTFLKRVACSDLENKAFDLSGSGYEGVPK